MGAFATEHRFWKGVRLPAVFDQANYDDAEEPLRLLSELSDKRRKISWGNRRRISRTYRPMIRKNRLMVVGPT